MYQTHARIRIKKLILQITVHHTKNCCFCLMKIRQIMSIFITWNGHHATITFSGSWKKTESQLLLGRFISMIKVRALELLLLLFCGSITRTWCTLSVYNWTHVLPRHSLQRQLTTVWCVNQKLHSLAVRIRALNQLWVMYIDVCNFFFLQLLTFM